MAFSLSSQPHHTHSIGLLWTSDQPDAKTSTWKNTQHLQETDIHAPSGIHTHNPSKQVATDPHHAATGIGLIFCYRLFYKHFASNILFPLLLPTSRPGPLLTPCKNNRDFLYECLYFLRINHLRCLICLIACMYISQKEREDHKMTESI